MSVLLWRIRSSDRTWRHKTSGSEKQTYLQHLLSVSYRLCWWQPPTWPWVSVCVCHCGVAWLSLCMYCQVNERLPLVSKLRFVYLFCSVPFSCHAQSMKQCFYSCIRSCVLQHDAASVLITQPPPVKTRGHSKGSEETSELSLKVWNSKQNQHQK